MERRNTINTIRPLSTSVNYSTIQLISQQLEKKYVPYIFLMDRQLNIHYSNLSEEKPFLGHSIADPSKLAEVLPPDDVELIREAVERMPERASTTRLIDQTLFKRSMPVRVNILLEPYTNEEAASSEEWIALIIERPELESEPLSLHKALELAKQKNEELRLTVKQLSKTNEYLDSFVSGAAHDLRGPLVVLKSYVDLIRRFDKEEKRLEALDHMKTAAIRFEKVISGLVESVEFQRKGQCNVEEVSFQKVYEMVWFQLSSQIELIQPKIQTNFSAAPKLAFIKSYLNSVLYNLMSNALKYRSEDRLLELHLNSYQEGEFVVLCVRDNGIGIDLSRYSDQLFEPFQRLTTQAEGIGIGLSLVNRMIEENGGQIKVESQPGEGTCFKVYLKPYDKK